MDIKFDQGVFDIILQQDLEGRIDLALVIEPKEVLMQRLFLRLKAYPRDLFWNINYGIDYLNDIFGKNKPINSVDVIIRNEILKEPMVRTINSFESEVVNYNYSCKFSVSVRGDSGNRGQLFYILTNENGLILTNEDGDILTTLI